MGRCCGIPARVSTPDDPVVLGAPNGAPPRRVRVNLNAYGCRRGTVGWFTGAGVDAAITGGVLTPL